MDPGHFTESWGRGRRFGMAALKDQRVYWFACLSATRPRDAALAKVRLSGLLEIFSGFHPTVQELLRATSDDDVIWTDIFDVPPNRSFAKERVVLLGDAAHAVTPDLGQGASQALEDAVVLMTLLAKLPRAQALKRFTELRIPRTERLVRDSRRYARLAQLSNPLAVRLRNALVSKVPRSITDRWINSILDVCFEPVGSTE